MSSRILSKSKSKSKSTIFTPGKIYPLALLLRLALLLYGTYQDAHSALKYTDIDYLVFTDAARFTAAGGSPYDRATYRYTPLLAWVLLPTTWTGAGWFAFGKVLFAAADVVAGWLLARTLAVHQGMAPSRALRYASVWLLNPMVANISTRGSSEGVLGLLTAGVVYLVLGCRNTGTGTSSTSSTSTGTSGGIGRVIAAGIVLGIGVHVKIYPFVYGVSVLLFLDSRRHQNHNQNPKRGTGFLQQRLRNEITPSRLTFTASALLTFLGLNALMYHHYGREFLQHTFLHHLTRVDHRHNFSVYASLLYDSAAAAAAAATAAGAPDGAAGAAAAAVEKVRIESWAFLPQLLLSVLVIPFALAKRSLPGAMLAQTFAFVAFNKVCTSQYFLWYLIFLPLYLPYSSFLRKPRLGVGALGAWVVAQALWLQQGYNLEFLGLSTFVPGLFVASLGFFAVNVWILGVIVQDVGGLEAGGGGY